MNHQQDERTMFAGDQIDAFIFDVHFDRFLQDQTSKVINVNSLYIKKKHVERATLIHWLLLHQYPL